MKKLYGYISMLFAAGLFCACESDLDKAYYADSQAKPAVLEALPESYVIDKLNQEAPAITVKWTAAQVGYQASVTNNIEMDIKGEGNFGDKKITLSSSAGTSTEVTFTNKELNDQMLVLLANYANEDGTYNIGEREVEFRVTSSISEAKATLVSNIVSSRITPYDNENSGFQPPVLNALTETAVTLDANAPDATVLTLNWQAAYLGDNANIVYRIEMNVPELDEEGAPNEAYTASKKVSIKNVSNETSCDLTNKELNDALVSLCEKYGMPIGETEVEIYVAATKSGYIIAQESNAVKLSLTPYTSTPELTDIPETMDLTSGESQTLTWSAVEGAQYQVELSIQDGTQKAVIATGLTETQLTIDNAELSRQIKYLLVANGATAATLSTQQDVSIQVNAYFTYGTYLLSEKKAVTVTYNSETSVSDVLYVIGQFCEWEPSNSQKLYKQPNSNNYTAQIVANNFSEGWKISRTADWSGENWGSPINDGGILTSNQYGQNDNIYSYGGENTSYTMSFDPNTGKLTMYDEEKSWMLVGDHNSYTFGNDSKMSLVQEEAVWYLAKTDVAMSAGDEWQIRSQVRNLEVTPQNIEGHFTVSPDDADKFIITETGTYDIRWYFNEATPYLLVIKK